MQLDFIRHFADATELGRTNDRKIHYVAVKRGNLKIIRQGKPMKSN